MGKLTRRVKFIARERRLSIPAEYLHREGIERGDLLWVGLHGLDLYAFTPEAWDRMRDLSEGMERWFPGDEHPFFGLFDTGIQVRLGSQDRVVLPRHFPYHPQATLRLLWEIQGPVLRLSPENPADAALPAPARPQEQTSMLDYLGRSDGGAFDRAQARRRLTEQVAIADIDVGDRSYSSGSPIPSESLLRSIRAEGVRHPVTLARRDDGSLQIVHGFRRINAARQLKLSAVPALVFSGLSAEDRDRLHLVESERDPAPESSPLRRLQSTVKLYQGQVDLDEIEKITGRRKRTLQRYLRVAGNRVLREAIESGRLSIFKAEEILKAGVDPESAIRRKMTVKEIRSAGRRQGAARRRARRHHGDSRPT